MATPTKTRLTSLPAVKSTFTAMGIVYKVVRADAATDSRYGLGFLTVRLGRGKVNHTGVLRANGTIEWMYTDAD